MVTKGKNRVNRIVFTSATSKEFSPTFWDNPNNCNAIIAITVTKPKVKKYPPKSLNFLPLVNWLLFLKALKEEVFSLIIIGTVKEYLTNNSAANDPTINVPKTIKPTNEGKTTPKVIAKIITNVKGMETRKINTFAITI